MGKLSLQDDPEGAFVPPEFDRTGNTFEAHIYSLGSTLTAAIEYVIEPELEPELSQELKMILEQMQLEKPEDRPDIEVCVYGVAAILWAAAKFNFSPNQKLALPRKLKRLLLEMAKRTPIERPSIAAARKTFKGDDVVKPQEAADVRHTPSQHESSCFKTGFVPIAGENKLTAIKGPVPCLYSVNSSSNLPDAFMSSATHFRPIILTQNTETAGIYSKSVLSFDSSAPVSRKQRKSQDICEKSPINLQRNVPLNQRQLPGHLPSLPATGTLYLPDERCTEEGTETADSVSPGSEAKIMLPKLKGQLEEMRAKVEFLELIKKYLEILCMEQWGLDTSLLPSLAKSVSGAATLNPSEDNSLLTFQSVKVSGQISQNKTRMLQAGTPLGLMCYLYARYAVLDGYVHQFLYTFRYFCTPKEFLQFLIDTLNSAVRYVASTVIDAQAGLLSTFLHTAKLCFELRNFATAMHILCGLENVIVRRLPAWKNLSSKVSEIMEELKAVQVFLKSDNLCLMEGDRFKKLPTIPSAHLLAMHVQQLEIGALTMANGAYKWPKLSISEIAGHPDFVKRKEPVACGRPVAMLCWGNASFGQLGVGGIDEEIVIEPRSCKFFHGKKIRDVGCGRRHTVFVLEDGTVYTCGCNDLGQLGHEKARKKPEHVGALDAQNIVAVSCGEAHTLALNDKGQVFAWGPAADGQLGLPGTEECVRVPRTIKSLSDVQIIQIIRSLLGVPFAQIAAGGAHSFTLTLSGAVFGWGRNKFGQLGLNDERDRYAPVHLKSLRTQKIVYISCGEDHTAALTKEGGVFTFGAGGYGQLGHNTTSHEINPRKVFELMGSVVTQIACGRQHTLAFVPSCGKIYSFGLGGNGQLGTGSTCNRSSPFTVQGKWVAHNSQCPPNTNIEEYCCVKRIYAGGDQSFAHYYTPANSLPADDFRNSDFLRKIYTLNYEIIQRWLNHAQGRLPADIANEIDVVFSSASCLNGSFLSDSHPHHHKTSSKFSGVDMNLARLLFHRLIQHDYPNISQQVAASIEKNLLSQLPNSPPDIEALRLYLTLPECPLFSDPNNFTTLAIPFALAIVSLKETPLKVLENWWSKLEPQIFQRIVQLYKEVVVNLLRIRKIGIPPSEQRIFNSFLHIALKVLEILHRDLNQGLEMPDMPVTICTYPFVFDAQAKTTLLQTDAVLQMQMAVDQAHRQNFSSFFMPVVESVDPCLMLVVRRENIVGDTMEVLRKTKNLDYKKPLRMAVDQAHRQNFSSFFMPVVESVNPCLMLVVRRENIVEDTMEVLRKTKNLDYKKPLRVIFVGEEAVDAGGVRKEFFLLIMRELLDPKYGMFRYYEDSRLIWFSDKTFEDIDLFNLIGVICGLAIYNLTIVDLHFPLALYKKLLKKNPTLDDLMELKPGVGRQDFVNAYVDYVFNTSVGPLFEAFYEGFHKVCGGKVLQLFQPNELQAMVIGNTNYDWKELEKSAEYKGEYWADHPTIKLFWEVFHELPLEEKKQFLLFLSGSDRIPILGMKSLKLVIQPTGGGEQYLPVAHTCFNLLDLPKYTDKQTLRAKLIQAIDHYEGFNLV
ncbi:UNVERIFIED_CONTAM: hypothetical protein FKN15_058286 [Acipenser sinensis]